MATKLDIQRVSEALRRSPLGDGFFGSLELAAAITKGAKDYIANLGMGTLTSPAAMRENSSVWEVWNDTRLEVMFPIFKYGASELALLADYSIQAKLFSTFAGQRPHTEFPHIPNNDPFHDTLQALFQGFVYLQELGEKVGAHFARNEKFFSHFARRCAETGAQWQEYDAVMKGTPRGAPPNMPPMMIHIAWEEITRLAKQVAICNQFGTNPEQFMRMVIARMQSTPGTSKSELENFSLTVRERLADLEKAKEPDDLIKPRR